MLGPELGLGYALCRVGIPALNFLLPRVKLVLNCFALAFLATYFIFYQCTFKNLF